MKVKYEEINVNNIKVGDKVKFDLLENNREVYTVTAVSEHFVMCKINHFGNGYYTIILKEPLTYTFMRNFNTIEKGSYIRGTSIYWGSIGDTPEELKFLEDEILKNKEYLKLHPDAAVYQANAEYYISQRNRVKIEKIFRRRN